MMTKLKRFIWCALLIPTATAKMFFEFCRSGIRWNEGYCGKCGSKWRVCYRYEFLTFYECSSRRKGNTEKLCLWSIEFDNENT